tara:strand:- start:211 stop:579 length:369 start_codon:yes stop_codon:yes gene_type:complete
LKLAKITSFICISLIMWNCNQSVTIESEDAINLVTNSKYYFLDVRTTREHVDRAIPNTNCIPLQEIEKRLSELNDYKDKIIIVYCRSGNRSGKATKILKENGFDAINLIGGINSWEGDIVQN